MLEIPLHVGEVERRMSEAIVPDNGISVEGKEHQS